MPVYVFFATFISNESQSMMENPLIHATVSNKLQSMGAKILNRYGPMSSYDMVDVIEVPDSETATKIQCEMNASETRIKPKLMGPYPSSQDSYSQLRPVSSK